MKMQTLALFGMVATAIGGAAYVFIYPLLSGERAAEKRRESVTRTEPVARSSGRTPQRSRRDFWWTRLVRAAGSLRVMLARRCSTLRSPDSSG